MIDFVVDNYLLIIIISIFLIFALIGYIIDSTKNRKNKEEEILTQKDDIVIDEIQNIQTIENSEVEPVVEIAKEEEFKIPEIEEEK